MLTLQLYDQPNGTLLYDWTRRARGVQFSTGPHGFRACQFSVPMGRTQAFRCYDLAGTPHVVIRDSARGSVVWEGRLEDRMIDDQGFSGTALGYWRALTDIPYTALWSSTSVRDWTQMETAQVSNRNPKLFAMDANNRIFVGLTKNAIYGNNTDVGEWYFDAPSGSSTTMQQITFDYNVDLPAGWRANVNYYTSAGFGGAVAAWTLPSAGLPLSGTATVNIPNAVTFGMYAYNASGASYGPFTGENGTKYARFTNIRVKSTTSSAIYADEITRALLAATRSVNSGQLNSSTSLIQSPGLDLRDELYLDAIPADILTRLAGLGDNQTPPRVWETGVWEQRLLHLRPRGTASRTWYIREGDPELERTLDELANSSYTVYQNADGDTIRSAAATDSQSVSRHGLTRRRSVQARTTSAAQAAVERDAFLADHKDLAPRARVSIRRLYDAAGVQWPLYFARAGDRIVQAHLIPTISRDIDKVRSFWIAETDYDADRDALSIAPSAPLPTLDVLLARKSAGF